MFKTISGLFKKKPVPVVPVTPELLAKRESLCKDLHNIYKTQLHLFNKTLDAETIEKAPLVKHYLSLGEQYEKHFDQIHTGDFLNKEFSEESFVSLINQQLDYTVSELEIINSKIIHSDLISLDKAYSDEIDKFFTNYHKNRIFKSFILKKYLYPKPLLQSQNSRLLLDEGIKTTSRMLSLNDYPVP